MSTNGKHDECPFDGYCAMGDNWRAFEKEVRTGLTNVNVLPEILSEIRGLRGDLVSAATEPARGVPRSLVAGMGFFFTVIIVALILHDTQSQARLTGSGFSLETNQHANR